MIRPRGVLGSAVRGRRNGFDKDRSALRMHQSACPFLAHAVYCAMFTGIIETTGAVRSIAFREGGARFVVQVGAMAGELSLGESVAVNGCCLTVTECDA